MLSFPQCRILISRFTNPVKGQKGFTLVELLAVLIIVAILAAVAVPTYMNYVRGARAATVQTTISAIVTANKIYKQKFDRFASKVEDLTAAHVLDKIDDATDNEWEFKIEANQQTFTKVTATSKEGMAAGAGKQIFYDVSKGKFTGYGFDE